MEQVLINNNIPQFDTPHSGKRHSKIKIAIILLILLAALIFNLWYYFGVFAPAPVAVVPEVVVPPTDAEKITIATDLQSRTAKISIDDKASMMQNLAMRSGSVINPEDRVAAIKTFEN